MYNLGERIKSVMKANGDTQEDLAKKIGYTPAGLGKSLKKKDINTQLLKKVAETYRIDIGHFFSGDFNQKGQINAIGSHVRQSGSYTEESKTKLLATENDGLKAENKALRDQIETLKEMITLLKERGK